MLNFLRNVFLIRKVKYYSWKEFKERADFLDLFAWQQRVRRQSLKNMRVFD